MIRENALLPELSHILSDERTPVFVTDAGRMGCLFEIPVIDLESQRAEVSIAAIERLVEGLPDGVTARFVQRAVPGREVGFKSFRSEAMGEIGFVNRRVFLSLECGARDPLAVTHLWRKLRGGGSALDAGANTLLEQLPSHDLAEIGARPLSDEEIREELQTPRAEVELRGNALDLGDRIAAVIRIYKPGHRGLTGTSLAVLLDQIPIPFEISVTLRKVPRARADFRLRSQLARGSVIQDRLGAAKQEATERALEDTSLHGASLLEMEWLLVLERRDEATLRRDLETAKAVLSSFGEVMIETAGCVPSYVASRIGNAAHFSFLEAGGVAPFYLPVFSFGAGAAAVPAGAERTLLLHRLDGSAHAFDQFDRRFLAYNALICGKTGSGKSVLANALSSALMQDPSVRMIKIDVGGSYRKECEVFGGVAVDFQLDRPSGVNPFAVLAEVSGSNEAIEIVGELLAILIREEEENQVPKAVRAQIEASLKEYVDSIPKRGHRPSIESFLAVSPKFPRRELLARWSKGGVFENAMRESSSITNPGSDRYRYFNFESIQAAANRDYAEGVMGAVITLVNLEMLRLGDRSKGQRGERLVLFCDETKFFIERFSQFFLLTSANFRKFGHGLVIMLQNIRNAEIRVPDGSVDRGLILNSPIRFFLQADTEADYLVSQFQFDEQHLRVVVTHPYRGREYREAVLQDDNGTRVVRLYLTDEEYWRMTSTREDVDKFNQLRAHVPGLTVEEAIRCLAASSSR